MPAADSMTSEVAGDLGPQIVRRLGRQDGGLFLQRLRRYLPDAAGPLTALYGGQHDIDALIRLLVLDVLEPAAARETSLRALDRAREADPGWFQDPRITGYVCYADRFAGTLAGVRERLDYLAELGVGYLHLMPVLAAREGENDGGYAVADYDAIDARLGTMDDLTALATDLHRRDIALCVDLVLNHTAREHPWAQRALAGDPHYRDFYLIYPNRSMPDAFEVTLPEIFPDMAPGSFTEVPELGGWVWTTFREFQWDLNYANPEVFRAMLRTMLSLANRGIDVLRLDAAPFLFKRLGTDCMDQPEAHLLLQAFRGLTRIAAPGLLLKAEAMLAPDLLGKYLGDHGEHHPECDLAYDNQLMVMLWSSAAKGDSALAAQALSRRRPAPDTAGWATYLRCHDDIGWAVADADAAAVGLDGPAHRRFLSEFYAGDVPGSFAMGERFQSNALGEAPTSGSAASLAGVERALDRQSAEQLEIALRRLESLYSVVFSFGGLPLIYMGDELAMLSDRGWQQDESHRGDNRWLHRPVMDWAAAMRAAAGTDELSVASRAFKAMARLARARASVPALRSNAPTTVLDTGNRQLFAYRRAWQEGPPLLAVVNFAESPQSADASVLAAAGIGTPSLVHSTDGAFAIVGGRIELPGCGFLWLSG